jgi:uncharacterized protein
MRQVEERFANPVPLGLFAFAAVLGMALAFGGGELWGLSAIHRLGGFCGLACAALAAYLSAAEVINGDYDRTVLPIGLRPKG